MLGRFGISARIFAGFSAILLLLGGVVVVSFLGLQTISSTFRDVEVSADQASEFGDYLKDFNAMVLSMATYNANPTAENAQLTIEWIDDVGTNDAEGLAKFESTPAALETIREIEVYAANYEDAFARVAAIIDERAAIAASIVANDGQFREALVQLLENAKAAGNLDIAVRAGMSAQNGMLMQQAADRYLQSGAEADYQTVMDVADETSAELAAMVAVSFSTGVKSQIGIVQTNIESMRGLISQVKDTIERQAAINAAEINVLADNLRVAYDELSAVIRQSEADAVNTGSQVVHATQVAVAAVSVGALVIGIALALITGRWLSSAIGNMSASMRRLADGDLDVELTGAEQRNELGLMAQALEVFQNNGKAMRSMDAEKEAERVREAAEQQRRADMQAEMARVVAAAAEGDFTARIEQVYDDEELDTIVASLNGLMRSVDDGLAETGTVMAAMAQADMTHRVNGEYKGAFARLRDDTNTMADKFADILGQLRETSRALKMATGEILSGANDLSERTTRQAATIEETTAAMEQLSATVLDNAQKAEGAAEKTGIAARMAEQGGEAMQQATKAMERITTSSSKISNIIGMIDDIAFQTNLLALNASVEAARAGEAGKGFAVVAVEVRRLAQSAAEASSEVKALIEQSANEVSDGSGLVSAAAGKLEEMLQAVQENSHLMQGISSASREQSSSIGEVGAAVRQMDEMTQHNAALVEEINAAIEQTESQASDLDRIVDIFKIDGAQKTSQPAPVSVPESGVRKLQEKVTRVAKTYLSQGNAAVDSDWNEF